MFLNVFQAAYIIFLNQWTSFFWNHLENWRSETIKKGKAYFDELSIFEELQSKAVLNLWKPNC
jgi:hypothetical protein